MSVNSRSRILDGDNIIADNLLSCYWLAIPCNFPKMFSNNQIDETVFFTVETKIESSLTSHILFSYVRLNTNTLMGKNKRYQKPAQPFSLVSRGPEFVKLDKRMRLGSVRKTQCSAHLSFAPNPLRLGLRPHDPLPFQHFCSFPWE